MSTVSLIQKLIISFIHGMFHFENRPGGHKQIIRCKLNPFMKRELILIRVWLHSRLYILSDDILWNLEKTKYNMPSLVHQRKNMAINIITSIKNVKPQQIVVACQCMRHVILHEKYFFMKWNTLYREGNMTSVCFSFQFSWHIIYLKLKWK